MSGPTEGQDDNWVLRVDGVSKFFPEPTARQRRDGTGSFLKAVDGMTLEVRSGETLAVVGESGCGKTTLGRTIVGAYRPSFGTVQLRSGGEVLSPQTGGRQAQLRYLRAAQMIFQDPFSSLNPRMTVHDIIAEPLVCHGWRDRAKIRDRVFELLEQTGLDPNHATRYPHSFSGGQRQRIVIARALALNPEVIVADEPVSALDVSIQAQILNLLRDLQEKFGLTYLFISHDLGVVERISDRIAVMYVGRLVEVGATEDILQRPQHPYTEALLSAVLRPDPNDKRERRIAQGEIVDPANRPPGCPYHPRCRYAQDICRTAVPELRPVAGALSRAACHFAEQLELEGV
jgi:peptide/nickel transport system ATP-binding protein